MDLRSNRLPCLFALGLAPLALAGCGDDSGTRPDVTPPGRVTDLRAEQLGASAALLLWTAPGDDERSGRATAYDARRARFQITAANWTATDALPGLRPPKTAGQPESLLVEGLVEGVGYYFALRAIDEAGNESRISNLPELTTDATPPGRVDSLKVILATRTAIRLGWKATGDDGAEGVARAYDIRYQREPLFESNWGQATRVPAAPAPLPAGEIQFHIVSGLEPGADYWFALKALDEAGNESPLSNVVQARTND